MWWEYLKATENANVSCVQHIPGSITCGEDCSHFSTCTVALIQSVICRAVTRYTGTTYVPTNHLYATDIYLQSEACPLGPVHMRGFLSIYCRFLPTVYCTTVDCSSPKNLNRSISSGNDRLIESQTCLTSLIPNFRKFEGQPNCTTPLRERALGEFMH